MMHHNGGSNGGGFDNRGLFMPSHEAGFFKEMLRWGKEKRDGYMRGTIEEWEHSDLNEIAFLGELLGIPEFEAYVANYMAMGVSKHGLGREQAVQTTVGAYMPPPGFVEEWRSKRGDNHKEHEGAEERA